MIWVMCACLVLWLVFHSLSLRDSLPLEQESPSLILKSLYRGSLTCFRDDLRRCVVCASPVMVAGELGSVLAGSHCDACLKHPSLAVCKTWGAHTCIQVPLLVVHITHLSCCPRQSRYSQGQLFIYIHTYLHVYIQNTQIHTKFWTPCVHLSFCQLCFWCAEHAK